MSILFGRRKPDQENYKLMLKRLSEAISQSNIESGSLASEINCPNHSSCNFSPKQNIYQDLEPKPADSRPRNSSGTPASGPTGYPAHPHLALHDRVNGGKLLSKTY